MCQTDWDSSCPSTTNAPPITTPRPRQCPTDWKEFEGNCYILLTNIGTWYEAEGLCEDRGAALTLVHSEREEYFLNHIIYYNIPYFLGGMIANDGGLYWIGDGSEVDYEHYSETGVNPGECLYQNALDVGKGWSSTSCQSSQLIGIMCKLSAGSSTLN